MMYRGPTDTVTRSLRRLWEVELFVDEECLETVTESLIAWNAVDANRRCGKQELAFRPKEICYVTWDDKPRKIFDPQKGPTDELAMPTMGSVDEWDF